MPLKVRMLVLLRTRSHRDATRLRNTARKPSVFHAANIPDALQRQGSPGNPLKALLYWTRRALKDFLLKIVHRSYKRSLRGPNMRLQFTLTNKPEPTANSDLPVLAGEVGQGHFTIDDLVDIRLQFDQKASVPATPGHSAPPVPIHVNISTKKTDKGKDVAVKLKVFCTKSKVSKYIICTETWMDFIEIDSGHYTLENSVYTLKDIEFVFTVSKFGAVTFADLYDDNDIVDFNLTLEDNKLPVHKACLAAHSNKFKTMFATVWKDINEGKVEVKGVTEQTLQYLKDYMYLGKLPDVDVRPMLLFAIHFSMPNLKADCITKLVETVEFYNLYSLLEFGCENNIPELMFALLVHTSEEIVHNAYEIIKNPPLKEPAPEVSCL